MRFALFNLEFWMKSQQYAMLHFLSFSLLNVYLKPADAYNCSGLFGRKIKGREIM